MFDSLKARDAVPSECGAQIFCFDRPDRNIALASPCSSCGVRSKAVCAGLNDEEMEGFSRNIHTRLFTGNLKRQTISIQSYRGKCGSQICWETGVAS